MAAIQLLLELVIILPLSVQGQGMAVVMIVFLQWPYSLHITVEVLLSPSPSVSCEAGEIQNFSCSHINTLQLLSDKEQNGTTIAVQWLINEVVITGVDDSEYALTCMSNQTSVQCRIGSKHSAITKVNPINGKPRNFR